MRLTAKLYITFSILLSIAIGGAVLTVWSAYQTRFHLERTYLAHKVYEAYLILSSHTYQLFQQFEDAMLIGDQDHGTGESILQEKLRTDIARIRNLIGQEIQLVGEEEIYELDRLAKIERQIEDLLLEHQAIVEMKRTGAVNEYWQRLSQFLKVKIDKDFNQLIQEGIDDEAGEVRETREKAAAITERSKILATVFALLATVATVTSLWMLRRDIKKPIEKLLKGASALSRGELEHRIDTIGPMELSRVALAFNRFFRGSNATANYGQGAGLGLPVAKAIVEAHGGKIVLSSEPTEGLTVAFTLPSRPQLKAVS